MRNMQTSKRSNELTNLSQYAWKHDKPQVQRCFCRHKTGFGRQIPPSSSKWISTHVFDYTHTCYNPRLSMYCLCPSSWLACSPWMWIRCSCCCRNSCAIRTCWRLPDSTRTSPSVSPDVLHFCLFLPGFILTGMLNFVTAARMWYNRKKNGWNEITSFSTKCVLGDFLLFVRRLWNQAWLLSSGCGNGV